MTVVSTDAATVRKTTRVPALQRHNFQGCRCGELRVEQLSQFTDGQAMSHGNRRFTDKTPELGVQQMPFDSDASNRIGAIQHDDANSPLAAFFEAIQQRPDKRVDSGADILQIHHKRVDVAEHLGGRTTRIAVQAVDGEFSSLVERVIRFDHVRLLFTQSPC